VHDLIRKSRISSTLRGRNLRVLQFIELGRDEFLPRLKRKWPRGKVEERDKKHAQITGISA
jgi:hypothetical protein